MPIMVQCTCGKRMGLSDALAGKSVKCPTCGAGINVPNRTATSVAARAQQKNAPAVYISAGKIVSIVIGLAIVIFAILFFLGPVKVWHQWEAVGPKAEDDIRDVVTFSLTAYLSQNGIIDPLKPQAMPSVQDVLFIRPLMAMSMPDQVKFSGKSSQGDFSGFYNPQTGEITADISYGGRSIAGLVDLAAPTGSFHITGSDPDHHPQATCNGQPLQIVYPKPLTP